MDKSIQVLMILAMGSFIAHGTPMYTKEISPRIANCTKELAIVSREEWGANPPLGTEPMTNPVPYVIIHHTYIPAACYTAEDCEEAMRTMQKMHQVTNGWDDIGYSFCIGGDNRIYMGRGWSNVGAHAPSYNNVSIGICFIGDYREELPSLEMMTLGHELIAYGLDKAYISVDYRLYGHGQVRETECPGKMLQDEITGWPHWDNKPPRYIIKLSN